MERYFVYLNFSSASSARCQSLYLYMLMLVRFGLMVVRRYHNSWYVAATGDAPAPRGEFWLDKSCQLGVASIGEFALSCASSQRASGGPLEAVYQTASIVFCVRAGRAIFSVRGMTPVMSSAYTARTVCTGICQRHLTSVAVGLHTSSWCSWTRSWSRVVSTFQVFSSRLVPV